MHIKSLEIYGFGKWVNKTFTFDNHFIAFLGHNETGKSTIQQFIHFILFGFPKGKKKDVNIFSPKTNEKIGGKLSVQTEQYGMLTIERVAKGKTKYILTITDDMGNRLEDTVLTSLLENHTLESYQQFFSITLSQLQTLKTISKEELNRYFLTLGTSGNDELFFLYDEWQKHANKLYRPKGEKLPINQSLEQLKKQTQKYNELANKQESYTIIQQDIDYYTKDLKHINETIHQLTQRSAYFEKVLDLYPIYQNFMALSSKDERNVLPDNIESLYNSHRDKKRLLQTELSTLKERVQHMECDKTENLVWFRNHSKDIKEAINKLPHVEKNLQEIATTEYQIDYLTESMTKKLKQFELSSYEELPKIYDNSNKAMLLYEQEQQFIGQKQDFQQQKLQYDEAITIWQSELTDLYEQKNVVNQSTVHTNQLKTYSIGVIISSIVMIMLFFFVHHNISILLGSLLVSNGIVAGCLKLKYNKDSQKHNQNMLTQIEWIHTQIERVNDKLAVVNQQKQDIQQRIDTINGQLIELEKSIILYKQSINIPQYITLQQYSSDVFKQLYNERDELEQLNEKIVNFQNQLNQLMQHYNFFEMVYMSSNTLNKNTLFYQRKVITTFKQFIDDMRIIDAKMIKNEENKQNYFRDIQRFENELMQLEDTEKEWLQMAKVTNIQQFELVLQQFKQQQYNRQQKEIMLPQITEYIGYFDTVNSINDITVQLEQVTSQKNECTQLQKQVMEKLAQLNYEKLSIEQDGTILDVQFELEQLKTTLSNQIINLGSYLAAMKMLELMLSNGRENMIDALVIKASELFKQVTLNRYYRIIFKDNQFSVVRYDGQVFELFELSQGTLDQLYIVLRLAFIIIVNTTIKLPVIIDDCFVNFDLKRRQQIFSILLSLSQTHQIIYMTYDNSIEQYPAQVIQLLDDSNT